MLLDSGATPKFCKAHSVSYFYQEKVENKLDRLVDERMLEPVKYSEWAFPLVAVLKQDKQSVRICGNFKQTVNPVSKPDKYPISKVEHLFAKLAKSK